MADHSLNAIRAAAKAMEEVVLQAVDPAHPLAREQAGLVARTLRLLEQRLDHAYPRSRFELTHACELGEALAVAPYDISPAITAALLASTRAGRELLASHAARPSALQAAATGIGQEVAALVRTIHEARPDLAEPLERLVLEHSGTWLDMQRAWFLPQGWEPDPARVPPLETLL